MSETKPETRTVVEDPSEVIARMQQEKMVKSWTDINNNASLRDFTNYLASRPRQGDELVAETQDEEPIGPESGIYHDDIFYNQDTDSVFSVGRSRMIGADEVFLVTNEYRDAATGKHKKAVMELTEDKAKQYLADRGATLLEPSIDRRYAAENLYASEASGEPNGNDVSGESEPEPETETETKTKQITEQYEETDVMPDGEPTVETPESSADETEDAQNLRVDNTITSEDSSKIQRLQQDEKLTRKNERKEMLRKIVSKIGRAAMIEFPLLHNFVFSFVTRSEKRVNRTNLRLKELPENSAGYERAWLTERLDEYKKKDKRLKTRLDGLI